jgi:ABC-2 type transport system ATP-binding protein
VAQAALTDLRGETGRTVVRVGDPAGAVALLDGRVVGREGDRLLLAGTTVAEVTARLVQAKIEVHEAAPERRSLEDVVLNLTSHGSDRVDSARPGDGRIEP